MQTDRGEQLSVCLGNTEHNLSEQENGEPKQRKENINLLAYCFLVTLSEARTTFRNTNRVSFNIHVAGTMRLPWYNEGSLI